MSLEPSVFNNVQAKIHYAPSAPTPNPEGPLFVHLVSAAERLNNIAAIIENRLEGVIARATGPTATNQKASIAPSTVGGHLGALDDRLTAALATLERVNTQLDAIERVI